MPRTRAFANSVTLITTAETILATLPGISPAAGQTIDIVVTVDITVAATSTGVTLNCRRGTTLTSTIIGNYGPAVVTASTRNLFSAIFTDTQGVDVANQQYIITGTVTGAGANSTANTAIIRADWG